MPRQETAYGFGGTVPLPFDEAVRRTREELANEGFGVLTEIDVAATLKNKLDVDFALPQPCPAIPSRSFPEWQRDPEPELFPGR